MSTSSKACRSSSNKGFTLIELLLVMAIIMIITGFVLLRQSTFSSSTLLRSLAYSIGLSMRQAQLYGTSVRGFTSSGGSVVYAPAYGAYFSTSLACQNGTNTCYKLFADVNGDNARDSSGTEGYPVYNISRSFSISKFCATTTAGTERCSDTGIINSLTIYFRRPSPDAYFVTTPAGGPYTSARIQISSGDGKTRSVTITNTGLISVGVAGT